MEFVFRFCKKRCKNAGGLARNIKCKHARQAVESQSLWKYITKALTGKQKPAIELKPIKKKPKQIRFKAKAQAQALSGPFRIYSPANPPESIKQYPDPLSRPRIRQVSLDENLSNFCAPPNLTRKVCRV